MAKMKATNLAKLLNISSKEVLNILNEYLPKEGRTATAALSSAEVNIVFEHLTQKNNIDNFDIFVRYCKKRRKEILDEKNNANKPKTEEAVVEKQEENNETTVDSNNGNNPSEEKAVDTADNEAKDSGNKPNNSEQNVEVSEEKKDKVVADKKQDVKNEKKDQKPSKQNNDRNDRKKDNKANQSNNQSNQNHSNQNQPKKKDKKDNNTIQPRTKGERKVVDTSNSVVNLGKYDDRYDDLAEKKNGNNSKREDRNSNKQKINKQKQQQQQIQKQKQTKKPKKETEAERKKRLEAERANRSLKITIPEEISVSELAGLLRVTPTEVVSKLFAYGVMATINQVVDYETAEIVATELGATVEKEVVVSLEEQFTDTTEDSEEDLLPRDPVVVVMGHVDHGKTSILDAIRHTAVTSTEAGGITQHIGAYRVRVGDKKITFLDTPGHEAFTSMRARGAMATDVAVLVVAADDGIMPQTIEAISHAKAAGVQVIVAINKMDKEGANPERIKQQLTEHELVPEEWGGDTICVPVSARTKEGIDDLLENILLVAEMLELKANPNRSAQGVVIEARLDKNRGPIATLLVQNGTLHSDDVVVVGSSWGKIRVMTNENGKKVKKAGPAVPVEIMGLDTVPNAGDHFAVANGEKGARQMAEERRAKEKEEQFNRYNKVTMENLFSAISDGELKELSIIVKADVQGSVEAVTQNLGKLSNDEVRVKVIHGAVGAVNDSDVMLASSSNAIIVGFNVRPDANAQASAERLGVDMRMYRVIYDAIEEIEAAMKGMLAPKFREVELGKAEIRNVFTISKIGKIAGCYITDGKVERNALVRVVRDGIVIADDTIASLQRGKDAVKEVMNGFECGIGLDKYGDIKEGDILECYRMEEYRD